MKYVSVDIETTGLESDKHKILSIGAIVEDTNNIIPFDEIPKFNALVLQREICGSPRALTMNKEIIEIIGNYLEGTDELKKLYETSLPYKFLTEEDVVKEFYMFLFENGCSDIEPTENSMMIVRNGVSAINGKTKSLTINVAGKNFGTFDKLFLQQLPWWQKLIRVRSRILDPSILCVDWTKDTVLPSLGQCKDRTGVSGVVTHDALEDAWDVVQVLRKFYTQNLFLRY